MSETPKKIEFIMMNDSAAELTIAPSVAFIDSAESYEQREETNKVIKVQLNGLEHARLKMIDNLRHLSS